MSLALQKLFPVDPFCPSHSDGATSSHTLHETTHTETDNCFSGCFGDSVYIWRGARSPSLKADVDEPGIAETLPSGPLLPITQRWCNQLAHFTRDHAYWNRQLFFWMFWRQCLHMARRPVVRAWKPTSVRMSLALQKLFYSCLIALHNFLNLGLFCCLHDSNHHWYPQRPKTCQGSCFSPRMKVNFPCWLIWEVYSMQVYSFAI